jgi:hypothetical protein
MYTKKTKRRIYVIYLEKFSLIGFIIIIYFSLKKVKDRVKYRLSDESGEIFICTRCK